jgi:copper chaperone NosL
MTRAPIVGVALALGLMLAGCQKEPQDVPPPQRMTAEAVGNYCGMNVMEHPGPKGQIVLARTLPPVWFSSVRDAIAFTMLPEEPKTYLAIYVSDMAHAPSWERPGDENWIEARKALYVIGSHAKGGMGAPEAVPFSDRAAADRFATENGGRVVAFADIPRDAILGPDGTLPAPPAATEPPQM